MTKAERAKLIRIAVQIQQLTTKAYDIIHDNPMMCGDDFYTALNCASSAAQNMEYEISVRAVA